MQNIEQFRVFISSTFKDMDKERSYLVEWIFPRVKELCEERGVEFFPVDLRWGIPEKAGKNGRILNACMEEIDNSRPFFIGLLGDRYGWRPSLSDLGDSATELLERYPWLAQDIEQELSITEIEMQYGALRNDDSNAVFYIRKGQDLCNETEEDIIEFNVEQLDKFLSPDYQHLNHLKETIENDPHVLSREFESPEDLGEKVFQDLKQVIAERFPDRIIKLQEEIHEQSFQSHLTNFVNLDYYHQQIQEALVKLSANHKFLALHGIKGAGKSTVLCTFIEQYRKTHPENAVFYYDIAKSFMHPLFGWNTGGHLAENPFVYEVRRFLEKVDKDLKWATTEKRIIAFDNVEYLIPEKHRTFIQELITHQFPQNTQIIITHLDYSFNPYHTSDDEYTESYISIDNLNAQKVHIHGIQRDEIPTYVEQYLKLYGKKLSNDQLMCFTKPLYAENPYYLGLALFQLIELGSFEKLDQTIDYLTKDEFTNTYKNELARWNWSITEPIVYILDNVTGRDRKDDWTGDILSILWLMFRNRGIDGFTERELIDIFHYTPARWALLRPQVLELCRYNNGYIEFADNMFSLILGRITHENIAMAEEAVIKYFETIPSIDELEEDYKKKGVRNLSEVQKHQVKQSLRKVLLLPWYKHCLEQTYSIMEKNK